MRSRTTRIVFGMLCILLFPCLVFSNHTIGFSNPNFTEPATNIKVNSFMLTVDVLTLGVTCYGDSNGNAVSQVSGGTMPYEYAWSNGDSTITSSELTQGNYSLTVTDAMGMTGSAMFEIPGPDSLSVTIENIVGCGGNASGSLMATSTGGSFPHDVLWSTDDTTNLVENISTGNYYVTITDANGCTATISTYINQPIELNSNPFPIATSCPTSSDGNIDVDVWGGSTPYTYIWSHGDSVQNAYNLSAGTYTITITDAVGCTSISSTTVDSPFPINLVVQEKIDVSCFGENDGSVLVNAFGGNPSYTFQWSNGGFGTALDSLSAGTYTVTVVDSTTCINTAEVTIFEPQPFQTFIFGSSVCNGSDDGTANAVVSGGTQPFSYLWSNGDTTAQIQNLVAGTYYLTATDAGTCMALDSITINLNTAIFVPNSNATMVSCAGENDGMASVSPTGGAAPFVYTWSNGGTDSVITNLPAGTYTVMIQDFLNCSLTEEIVITEPTAIDANATVTNASACGGGGEIILASSGGTGSYTYLWSNTFTSDTLTNLAGGTYTVTITDANFCASEFSFEVTSSNNAPTVFTQDISISLNASGMATIDATQIDNNSTDDCGIAFMSLDIVEFDCSHLGANTVTLSVTDSDNQTSTGTATVTVVDDMLPTVMTQNVTVYLDAIGVAQLDAMEFNNGSSDNCGIDTMYLNTTQLNCAVSDTSTVTLTVVDNNGNMQTGDAMVFLTDTISPFLMCPDDITVASCDSTLLIDYPLPQIMDNCPAIGNVVFVSGAESGDEISVGTTTTVFEYTDIGGNTTTCSFDFTLEVAELLEVQLDSTTQATSGNNDGAAYITVTSGAGPYAFTWNLIGGSTVSTEEDPTNLPAGNYEVVVTNTSGCETTLLVELSTSIQNPELVSKVELFPNPTSDVLKINMDLTVEKGNSVRLFSLDGKVLLEKILSNGEQSVEWNINEFPSGVYVMQLTVSQGVVTKRVVVR